MKKNYREWTAMLITAICILSFLLIIIRLFAKVILVDALDTRNETVSLIADYCWGDQLSRHMEKHYAPGYSDEYKMIRKVYDATVEAAYAESGYSESIEYTNAVKALLEKYGCKIDEFEAHISNYCNEHFILRTYLTDLKLACNRIVKWDMTYARKDGDEYMLRNGVVEKAVTKDEDIVVDTSVKDAADKYGVEYIYLKYPYRVSTDDSYVPFGAENWSNYNTDRYLEALRASGTNVLDLRKELAHRGWDNHEGYYRTDSHWKTNSGFESAEIVSEYLANNIEGFVYHPEYHDKLSYNIMSVELSNPMVREDVKLYLPAFDTNLRFICLEDEETDDIELSGEFADTVFDMEKVEYGRFSNVLTAYSASRIGMSLLSETKNEMDYDHYGTVLFISDSFSWHLVPYLALDCERVLFLHNNAKGSAAGIIEKIKPDVVIEAQ